MSDFVQQQSVECRFESSDSWVILSPIEQSIKRKIESVGTPLKDWDIQINYGIKTGFNDAFIINTEKRNEILDNCSSEEERTKTAELIRPILRGRDIKRYGYNWADLWLIATFPSRHYDIEMYPAVKAHLLSFGKERLEQTGKKYIINGEEIKARKKTSDILTRDYKAFLIGQMLFVIIDKWQILSHIWIHYFWLKKIVQISAVPKIVRGITLICSL